MTGMQWNEFVGVIGESRNQLNKVVRRKNRTASVEASDKNRPNYTFGAEPRRTSERSFTFGALTMTTVSPFCWT